MEGKGVRQDLCKSPRHTSRYCPPGGRRLAFTCLMFLCFMLYGSHMLCMLSMTHFRRGAVVLRFSVTYKKLSRQTVKLFAEIWMCCLVVLRICTKCPHWLCQSVRSEPGAFWFVLHKGCSRVRVNRWLINPSTPSVFNREKEIILSKKSFQPNRSAGTCLLSTG